MNNWLEIQITSMQAEEILREADAYDENYYNGIVTAKDMMCYLDTITPNRLFKEIIQKMAETCYGVGSEEAKSIKKLAMRNERNQNFGYIKECVYIDGVRAATETSVPEPAPAADPEPSYAPAADPEPSYDPAADPEPSYEAAADPEPSYDPEDTGTYTESAYAPEAAVESEPEEMFNAAIMPATLEEAQKYYDAISDSVFVIDREYDGVYFDSSTNNMVYENAKLAAADKVEIMVNVTDDHILEDFCLVVSESDGRVAMLGKLMAVPGQNGAPPSYCIEAEAENIDFDVLRSTICYQVVFINQSYTNFYSGPISLELRSCPVSEKRLCVDFGTSNTTCGIDTDDGVKIVRFMNMAENEIKYSCLCPTVVYVSKICDKNPMTGEATEVEYLFGYEAKKMLEENNYNPKGSIFFEIKRWITDTEKMEEITDGSVNAKVKRGEIIRQYLLYVVKLAENDLKCKFYKFHFSAPVKLKSKLVKFLKDEVFIGEVEGNVYDVMNAQECIDEGVAIVYNSISDTIQRADREGTQESADNKIMIIDCGGGTTDLASCKYGFSRTATGYDLNLETRFENGNSNFGGNNITYRIFQFLKIKLAAYYRNQSDAHVDIADLINVSENEVLNAVDQCVKEGKRLWIYDELDKRSRESEEILPTDFNGNSVYAKNNLSKSQTKRNFYYLWQIAEKIKIKFFANTHVVTLAFNATEEEEVIQADVTNLYFYIKNTDESFPPLKKTNGVPQIRVNTKEITTLIRPDIYYLLTTIFSMDETDGLDKYDSIKLSGQSCKISLFQDLLKEFVPGRRLRTGETHLSSGQADSEKLKLECVCGSIAYVRDKEYHRINSFNKQASQRIIYDVEVNRGGDGFENHKLFAGASFRKNVEGTASEALFIDQHNAARGKLKVKVFNTVGTRKQERMFDVAVCCSRTGSGRIALESDSLDVRSLRQLLISESFSDIEEYIVSGGEDILTQLLDDIRAVQVEEGRDKVLVFALPNSDGYGFILYQLLKCNDGIDDTYYLTYHEMHTFEDNVSTRSFFNGNNCTVSE